MYTVGCLLYELLAGKRPFHSRLVMDEIARIQSEPPPRLDGVPAEVADLVNDLLAKEPTARPGDALPVYTRLRPWLNGLKPIPGWTSRDLASDPAHLYTAALATLN
jgi:non-specific serine/threonine protein kinase